MEKLTWRCEDFWRDFRVPTSPFSARLPSQSKRSEPFMCVGVSLMMSEAIKSLAVCKCIARC
ncbi:hypothetical protein Hanom_Chr16g01432221 [Helianthus anomalus]